MKRYCLCFFALLVSASALSAVAQSLKNSRTDKPDERTGYGAPGSLRVYLSASESWDGRRSRPRSDMAFLPGDARTQSAEIIKMFNERCPQVTVTDDVKRADFTVVLNHEHGKGLSRRRNKIVVFDRDGDDIFSGSTRKLSNALKDACSAILAHAQAKPAQAFSLPFSFEPAPHARDTGPQFVARGASMEVALTRRGIEIAAHRNAGSRVQRASLRFVSPSKPGNSSLSWRGAEPLPGETNYLLGNNPAKWRTHIPHYERVEANDGKVGIDVHARDRAIEYDLRLPPGEDASKIRVAVSGARNIRLDARGDLLMRIGETEFRMAKPAIYEETSPEPKALVASKFATGVGNTRSRPRRSSRRSPRRRSRSSRRRSGRSRRRSSGKSRSRSSGRRRTRRTSRRGSRGGADTPQSAQPAKSGQIIMTRLVDGKYILDRDGTIGFRVARRNRQAALVIDPVISLAYASFLGGTGNETASSIATDSSGKVYIAGTTTSPATFPEAATAQLGPGPPSNSESTSTPHEFFIAKMDPTQSGPSSLVYLTFLGGSADQVGGLIAVDPVGNVAITGTTTSADFPVTDASVRTSGTNDTIVSKLDPTGSTLLYSTLFGGNGAQSQQNAGGIALDAGGRIFVVSDTNSPDLPVTAGAYAATYTSPISDGFLAIFQPGAIPPLSYCSYLGLNGKVGVGGIALDAAGDAYIAGYTSDPNADFPLKLAAQPFFGGGAFDAFLMKLAPAGNGAADLVYATLLGGNGSDQAFAVALDSLSPPNAYVTGTSNSRNFPVSGAVAAYQATLPSNATAATSDAFVTVIAQDAGTGQTSIVYSTYLGGSQKDTGFGIQAPERYSVYVTGTANSWDFPWRDNFQPFNGYGNAFVVELDTTTPGVASLIYSTPLGGTSPAGVQAGTQGSAIALDTSGNVWVAGQTTSGDFSSAGNPGNGFQQICASCQASPIAADAFVAEIQSNVSQQLPSVYFAAPGIPLNFGIQGVGATNVPSQFAAIKNGGEAPLLISSIGITGPNSSDFSLANANCMQAVIAPGGMCSFEVGFVPSMAGAEQAFVQVTTNAPGSPQVLEAVGTGAGLAAPLGGINFGSEIVGVTSAPKSVTLTNTSPLLLFIDSVVESGPDVGAFAPATSPQQCAASATAFPFGASCVVLMTFTPTSATAFAAEVDIGYHLSGQPEQATTIPLTGSGSAGAGLAASAGGIDFGQQVVGVTYDPKSVTLTNTSPLLLFIDSVAESGRDVVVFRPASSSQQCGASSTAMAPGSSCMVVMSFVPTGTGAFSAEVDIGYHLSGQAEQATTIPLTGSGIASAPIVANLPAGLDFGTATVGGTTAARVVTLWNKGTAPLDLTAITLAGTNASDFAIVASGNTPCPVSGGSVGVNGLCSVGLQFAPQTAGAKSAALSFADNASGSPQTVALTGNALTPPAIQIAPSSLTLGPQPVGTKSAPQQVTITNTGQNPLAINSVSVTGTNASDFTQTNNCPPSLAISASCVASVVFQPALPGIIGAWLSIVDNAAGSPQNVALSGTATQPAVTLSTPAINFGNQAVGTPSAIASVTVTNSGNGALLISSISLAGANSGDFVETDNCSGNAAPNGVAPGMACTIQITFKPSCGTLTAARSATLTLADNAPAGPQTIALSGTGTGPFCFALASGGSLAASVVAGATASYALQLEAANGFTGNVNLACAGAPSYSTCTIAPSGVNIGGSEIVGFQVNVATSAGTAILWRGPGNIGRRGPNLPPLPVGFALAAVVLAVALVQLDRERSLGNVQPCVHARQSRVQGFAILAGAACALAIVLAACGGSAGLQAPPPVDPRTPAGTYSIVVTGTGANAASQSVTLILTVQ